MRPLHTLARSPRTIAVILVVVLCSAVVGAISLDHRPTRDRAAAWAETHQGSATTLAELAAYPGEYRDALVATLSPADKSRLWQEQFAVVLASETLTPEQRAFITDMQALVTPATFEPNALHPEVCPDVARLFPDPALRLKVRTLATATPPAPTVASRYVSVVERVRSAVTLNAENACNCEGWGICECGIDRCEAGNCTQGGSCGCIWKGPCTGQCANVVMNVIKQQK